MVAVAALIIVAICLQEGDRMQPYLEPQAEFFDRAAVPPQIQELLDEWREIDPGTARLIRAAIMSRDQRRLRQAGEGVGGRGRAGAGAGNPPAPWTGQKRNPEPGPGG